MLNLTSIQEISLPSTDATSPLASSNDPNQASLNATPFQEILGQTLTGELKTEHLTEKTADEILAANNELLIETSNSSEIPINLAAETNIPSDNLNLNLSILYPPLVATSELNQIDQQFAKVIDKDILKINILYDNTFENDNTALMPNIGEKPKTGFSTLATNQNYSALFQTQVYQNNSAWMMNASPYSVLNQLPQSLARDVASDELDINPVNFAETGKILPVTTADFSLTPQGGSLVNTLSSSAPTSVLPIHHQITTELGKPTWGNDFNQQITWLATQKHQVAELHLHPAELGPVEVILHISNDQSTQVSAQFSSPHPAVREAIESALPRLREMMAENGITLGNTTVGTETSQQHPNWHQESITSTANEARSDGSKIQGLSSEFDGNALPLRRGLINTFA